MRAPVDVFANDEHVLRLLWLDALAVKARYLEKLEGEIQASMVTERRMTTLTKGEDDKKFLEAAIDRLEDGI